MKKIIITFLHFVNYIPIYTTRHTDILYRSNSLIRNIIIIIIIIIVERVGTVTRLRLDVQGVVVRFRLRQDI